MKTNNSKEKNPLNKEKAFFEKAEEKRINKIARFTGFIKRKSTKIKPIFFILGFHKMTMKNLNTYEDWSCEIAILNGKSLSMQAVEERMSIETANMMRLVFEENLSSILSKAHLKDNELSGKFNEIKNG